MPAVSVHFLYECGYRVHWSTWKYPVPEIEDVSRRGAKVVEHLTRSRSHLIGGREQHRRVEIALQHDASASKPPCVALVGAPFQPQRVAAALHHRPQPRIPAP